MTDTANDTCPTCGAPLQPDACRWDMKRRLFFANQKIIHFTPIRARLIDALWRTRNTGGIETRERLLEMIYFDKPNGGPENYSTLTTHIINVRKQLKRAGYTITRNMGRPRKPYKLVKL